MAKHLKKILKYVKNEVSSVRASLFQTASKESNTELKLTLEVEAKRALAVEKLFLSLALVAALPEDLE